MRTKFNWRTLSISRKFVYGIYGEDFLQYGVFKKRDISLDDEELLLEIAKDNSEEVAEKTTFKFDTDKIHFSHDVNPNLTNAEVNHQIQESVLIPQTRMTWTEGLFYNAGNKVF